MDDVSGLAVDRYHELLRAMKPHERLAISVALTAIVRKLATSAIRRAHPDASDDEVRMRLTARLYGREAAQRLFPSIPDDC